MVAGRTRQLVKYLLAPHPDIWKYRATNLNSTVALALFEILKIERGSRLLMLLCKPWHLKWRKTKFSSKTTSKTQTFFPLATIVSIVQNSSRQVETPSLPPSCPFARVFNTSWKDNANPVHWASRVQEWCRAFSVSDRVRNPSRCRPRLARAKKNPSTNEL